LSRVPLYAHSHIERKDTENAANANANLRVFLGSVGKRGGWFECSSVMSDARCPPKADLHTTFANEGDRNPSDEAGAQVVVDSHRGHAIAYAFIVTERLERAAAQVVLDVKAIAPKLPLSRKRLVGAAQVHVREQIVRGKEGNANAESTSVLHVIKGLVPGSAPVHELVGIPPDVAHPVVSEDSRLVILSRVVVELEMGPYKLPFRKRVCLVRSVGGVADLGGAIRIDPLILPDLETVEKRERCDDRKEGLILSAVVGPQERLRIELPLESRGCANRWLKRRPVGFVGTGRH